MFDFLSQKFTGILGWLKGRASLTQENIAQATTQIREALIDADVPLTIVDDFLQQVHQEIIGKKVESSLQPGQLMIKIVHEKVMEFLGGKNVQQGVSFQIPSIIMVMGLQGSGKTTTVAKIAHWVMQEAQKRGKKRRVLLGSVDFYRPAAVDQLALLAKQIGVDFYQAQQTNPVKAAQEIAALFKKNSYDLLFLDTAGRLHVDDALMSELININTQLMPKYKFLVLDAMTGQESLRVAKAFDQAVGFDSVALTKMDSDTRGGAAFAFRYALKKPISFVGSGEKIDDLDFFIPERMTSRILGMGDMMTLIEKANETIDERQQQTLNKRFMEGNFTLKDFADQMSMMDKLGSLQKIVAYLPGMNTLPQGALEKGQLEIKIFRAIIDSMTPKERRIPQILDGSRKKRIAQGAGVTVQDINQLLQRFDQSKQFVKMFKNNGMFKKFLK